MGSKSARQKILLLDEERKRLEHIILDNVSSYESAEVYE